MRLREDVVLAPVTPGLKNAVTKESWLHDSESNWKLGFGRGVVGVDVFVQTFREYVDNEDDNFGLLGIYYKRQPVGFAAFTVIDRAADLFFYIAPEYRNTFGVASTALYWCLEGIFNYNNITRVQIELLSINKEAISFLRKFGFKQEGIKKSAYWMGVNSFNIVMLAMLKHEFNWLKEEQNA